MSDTAVAPIIIKRKKVVAGGGHHGGAWKVAYADFVTAMMAFFMLMWLLGSVSEEKKSGIASYFAPTASIAKASGGGEGMFGGDNIFTTETSVAATAALLAESDAQASDAALSQENEQLSPEEAAQVAALQNLEDILLAKGGESVISDLALRHIITRLTDEGLVIELFDLPNTYLFKGETDLPSDVTTKMIEAIARLLSTVSNGVAINSHLAAQPLARRSSPTWDLSLSRSSQTRKLLESGGLNPERIKRVTGTSNRNPAISDILSIRNNRIEIIILR